jgi:hypothetical protein
MAVAVLAAGSVLGHQALTRSGAAGSTILPASVDGEQGSAASETFRVSFWGNRGLDVAVQVGLVFVAALGIAALLPSPGEDGEA